ncbi:hypothetical protein [Rhizobium sp. S163]|uniref:hypothetical protein n=1 Tax=Rhizobium sp. S163 TaxID=3055039 RepID=UPI0025A9E798|nr:hypothetical protein [Rhizobium sp. S163]MDM9646779.1 hypothetical protein [Rhizobium sp. S163]
MADRPGDALSIQAPTSFGLLALRRLGERWSKCSLCSLAQEAVEEKSVIATMMAAPKGFLGVLSAISSSKKGETCSLLDRAEVRNGKRSRKT